MVYEVLKTTMTVRIQKQITVQRMEMVEYTVHNGLK